MDDDVFAAERMLRVLLTTTVVVLADELSVPVFVGGFESVCDPESLTYFPDTYAVEPL